MHKQLSERQLKFSRCNHQHQAQVIEVKALECTQCVAMGGRWVHLRVCMVCGQVGCCDSSPHKHATVHATQSGHPIVMSVEPGEAWAWCYDDKVGF